MGREFIMGMGPAHKDRRLLGTTLSDRPFWDIVATTNEGIAPPQLGQWLQFDDGAAPNGDVGGSGLITQKNFQWLVFFWRLEGDSTSGDDIPILANAAATLNIRWIFDVDADHYKLRIRTSGSSDTNGAHSLNCGSTAQTYAVMIQIDKAASEIKVWATPLTNGAGPTETFDAVADLEITHSDTEFFTNKSLKISVTTVPTSMFHNFSGILLEQSDSESDRPEPTTLDVQLMQENAEGPDSGTPGSPEEAGFYRDKDALFDGDAQRDDIALTVGLLVDTTKVWIGVAGGSDRQNVELDTPTPGGAVTEGVAVFGRMRAAISGKTLRAWLEIVDSTAGPDYISNQLPNLGLDTFRSACEMFPLAPDGTDWKDFTIANLGIGVRDDSGNNANDVWQALCAELFSIDDDPNAPVGYVPAGTAQVGGGIS